MDLGGKNVRTLKAIAEYGMITENVGTTTRKQLQMHAPHQPKRPKKGRKKKEVCKKRKGFHQARRWASPNQRASISPPTVRRNLTVGSGEGLHVAHPCDGETTKAS